MLIHGEELRCEEEVTDDEAEAEDVSVNGVTLPLASTSSIDSKPRSCAAAITDSFMASISNGVDDYH